MRTARSSQAVAMHSPLSVCHCELYEHKRYVKDCDDWGSCGGAGEDPSCRGYDTVETGKLLAVVTS